MRPSRWLLHAFLPTVLDAKRSAGIEYTAGFIGPERIEKSIQLPPATSAGWSPDGHWLALCSPVPSSDAEQGLHQLLAIRFDGAHTSDPMQLGDCTAFDWAPAGQRLLIQDRAAWRLVDLSAQTPRQTPIAAELASPIEWSPNGRRILAHSADTRRDLRVVHALEPTPRVEALDINRDHWRGCRWSPQDALACVIDTPTGATIQFRYANPTTPTQHTLDSRLWSFDWATENTLVYQLKNAGAVFALQTGTAIPLFTPGDLYGLEYQRLSPQGTWLLDTASGHVRLWNLTGSATSTDVPGLEGSLLNPRWSPNGQHALVGVQHRRVHPFQTDVWLVAQATKDAQVARIASVEAGQATVSWFSPGSEWVFVSTGPDVIQLASTTGSAKQETAATRSVAVHVATRTTVPLPLGIGEWSRDDSAFVAIDREDGQMLVVRVRDATFAEPELVRSLEPGVPTLMWQPTARR